MTRCDAAHDGHDCATPGACTRAVVAMCERVTAASAPPKRVTSIPDPELTYSLDPITWKAKYA